MKKFLICLATLILFGCNTTTETQGEIKQNLIENKNITKYYGDISTTIIGIEIEGHQYIIYSGPYEGNIIHAEHCPCHDTIK